MSARDAGPAPEPAGPPDEVPDEVPAEVPAEMSDGVPAGAPAGRPARWWRGRCRLLLATLALVLLAGAVVVGHELDLGRRWGLTGPAPAAGPAAVSPPAGLALPPAGPLQPVARRLPARPADPVAVARVVRRQVASDALGRRVAVEVAQLGDVPAEGRHDGGPDAVTGQRTGQEAAERRTAEPVAYRSGPEAVTPASTLKLLTAVAALEALGPAHRFSTTVTSVPGSSRVILVGGGDPLLASRPSGREVYPARADLDTLAARTATALLADGRDRVRLGYDASLFRGPAVNPHWEDSYVPEDVVSPITALWVEEGRDRPGGEDRSRAPARRAAAVFAAALRRHGVEVRGRLVAGRPPANAATARPGARPVASVHSAPLSQVVQHVLEVSDNEGAEVLARQVALAQRRPASFDGASRAVRAVLGSLGVRLTAADRLLDGSGLSRGNRLRPETLVALLRVAAAPEHPRLRAAVTGLPVAGFTGSLAARFETGNPLGPGVVRAKTGTLSGVHALAGTLTTRDGAVLAFAAVADRVRAEDALEARARLDELAAALAGCACAATP